MIALEMLGYRDPRPGSQRYPPGLGYLYPDRGDFIGLIGNLRTLPALWRLTRRGPDRAEEQDHPALGQTWHPPVRPQGPKDSLGLPLRGHLPGPGQRSGAGPAPLPHAGHDLAP